MAMKKSRNFLTAVIAGLLAFVFAFIGWLLDVVFRFLIFGFKMRPDEVKYKSFEEPHEEAKVTD
jgi:hypothetical protein